MSTLTQKELYGNFQSDTLQQIIARYMAILPEDDLPSDAILNTTILFLRGLFYLLGPEHEYRWEGDLTGEEDEENTGIHITSAFAVEPKIVERRPAILVQLQQRQALGLHTGQLKHLHVYSDILTKSDLISGALVTHVICREEEIARRLADWIGLSYILLVKFLTFARFHNISPPIWSSSGPAGDLVKGGSEHDYCKASVAFNYTWGWTGRVEVKEPLHLRGVRVNIVSYGRPMLDGAGGGGDIVEPDSVSQLLYEEEEES